MITREAFTDAMKLAVLVRGSDYIYPVRLTDDLPSSEPGKYYEADNTGGCDYRRDGEPSCLIGTAMDILGIVTVAEDEGKDAGIVLMKHGVDDLVLRDAAATAQEYQDLGVTWGEALEYYLDYVRDAEASEKKISERQQREHIAKGLVAWLAERIATRKSMA